MLRLCLCMLIVMSSATAAAREVRLSSPNSGACPDAAAESDEKTTGPTAIRPAVAPKKALKPSVHGDVHSPLRSPRWHSYLPGMFR